MARTSALEGGGTLYSKSSGSGRDIVLIHGALTTHADWGEDLIGRLAGRGRVTAVDRPGHGESRRRRFAASPLEQARLIRQGLQRELDRPILIGHSFGALVASAWAAAYPEELSGLILVSPIAFPEFRLLEHTVFGPRALPVIGPILSRLSGLTLDRALITLAQKAMFAPRDPPADWLERYPYRQIEADWAMVAEGEDAASMLPGSLTALIDYSAITAPVGILVGERDHVVHPERHGRPLARLLPSARLTSCAEEGHMLHHTAGERLLALFDELADDRKGHRH